MSLTFIDLCAGLGNFNRALTRLGYECVFASEIDSELRELYKINFPRAATATYGDIRIFKDRIPPHDILCAGFPCQPFSKSGSQKGLRDKTRGTLFHEIIAILRQHHPKYILLENVGNFERHDGGRTWRIVRKSLESLGYDVKGTEHIKSGGSGLLSPHHFGHPHRRERFFIVAALDGLPENPLPTPTNGHVTDINGILQSHDKLSDQDRLETRLSNSQIECIEHWNDQLNRLPESEVSLPSFPIWTDEIDATYPYERYTPYTAPISELRECVYGKHIAPSMTRDEVLQLFPSYARSKVDKFPDWKIQFIRQNRQWFKEHRRRFPKTWLTKIRLFTSSLRKLEWNCQGEERNLWRHVLQFRPSGLRVKRYNSSPSLVAMTTTQIPILGPQRRFLTRAEGLRLQGMPDTHRLPKSYCSAFKALGNAVHIDVVEAIARQFIK